MCPPAGHSVQYVENVLPVHSDLHRVWIAALPDELLGQFNIYCRYIYMNKACVSQRSLASVIKESLHDEKGLRKDSISNWCWSLVFSRPLFMADILRLELIFESFIGTSMSWKVTNRRAFLLSRNTWYIEKTGISDFGFFCPKWSRIE